MDETATPVMRMIGASFLGALLMAPLQLCSLDWRSRRYLGIFNLIFVQNLCIFIVNTYSIKIDKTGIKNDLNEGVIAPLFLQF